MSLFTFPRTQAAKASPLVTSLLRKFEKSSINAVSTLPQHILTKEELNEQIMKDNPKANTLTVKVKQSMGYAKSIASFYKSGVSNVWNNKKEVNKILKTIKLENHVNNRGKVVDIKVPNLKKLTFEMAQEIYMRKIESGSVDPNDIVRHHETEEQRLFNLSRAQYQLIKRTGEDFYKIPLFGLVFMIFMEFTPVVCYTFPDLAPSTCILPSLLPKLWKIKPAPIIKGEPEEISDFGVKNSYNLSLEELRVICYNVRFVSKYIPASLYPEQYLRNQLQDYYNYLSVDNYYLAGLNGEGNVWNLSNEELILACLERNMINIKELKHTEESLQLLRLELFRFIANFEKHNIGYLLAQHSLEKVHPEELSWTARVAT